jgi:hypothetical protein
VQGSYGASFESGEGFRNDNPATSLKKVKKEVTKMPRFFLLPPIVALLVAMLFYVHAVAPAAATAQSDIAGPGVMLGDGWYKEEAYGGQEFRWVDNDASFSVRCAKSLAFVAIRAEGGPGLSTTTFPLIVRDASGRQVDAVEVTAGQPQQTLILPVVPNEDTHFSLHVDGGGKRMGSDSRTLNFRVFSIAEAGNVPQAQPAAQSVEITSSDVRLGDGWYPLENFKGETFRWVRNDAQLVVHVPKDGHAQLKVAVQAGPSLAASPLHLDLRDARGEVVGSASVKDRAVTYFTVDLTSGNNVFFLHANDAGAKVASGDSRVLNFRVFRLALVG